MRSRQGFFNVMRRLFGMLFGSFPLAIMFGILVSLLHGVSLGFITLATQGLFDGLYASIEKQDLRHAMLGVALIGSSFVVNQLLNGIDNFTGQTMRNRVRGRFMYLLHEKAAKLSPIVFEEPETLDVINKSREGSNYAYTVARTGLLLFTFYLSYLVFIGTYLYKLSPILVAAIPICFVPAIVSQAAKSSAYADLEDAQAPMRRLAQVNEQHIVGKPFYRETRILGAYAFLRRRYVDSLRELSTAELATRRGVLGREVPLTLFMVGAYLSIVMLLVRAFYQGTISVGAFAAILASVDTMFETVSEIVSLHLGSFSEEFGKARNFIAFLDLPEDGAVRDTPSREERSSAHPPPLVAESVSFAYPSNKEKKVLDGISLAVSDGETIAIVGPNGAGKSTLAKLLMGLYQPDEGRVLIRGVDSRERRQPFEGISAVFQTYGKYNATLRENITISDLERDSQERLAQAITAAAVEGVAYEEVLGREYGGTDVSGGQWQRIAIARGLYRVHDIILLDEPTAAIDPLEEGHVYRTFRRVSQGKTSVIVTHRLGAARIADRIYLIEGGHVVESGTHEQLLSAKGLYAEMYEVQAKTYINTNKSPLAPTTGLATDPTPHTGS